MCCSVLQCVAVCCRVLPCVAVTWSRNELHASLYSCVVLKLAQNFQHRSELCIDIGLFQSILSISTLLSICRALFSKCRAHFSVYRALLSV